MNEFTKEELQSIVGAFRYVSSDPGWTPKTGWDDELLNKIQSMIDNYCKENGHAYEFSLGTGYCENCNLSENDAFMIDNNCEHKGQVEVTALECSKCGRLS